jgi:hypothetical protein
VIVDVDLDRFDGDIAIGMHRQWSQCRAVQLLKCVTSVTGFGEQWNQKPT